MKELNNVNLNDIISPRLPQSKSYLKLKDIPYFHNNTNLSVTSDIIEGVIKSTCIFDNMVLASYSQVIKASSKSNIAVIWVDIWNSQNGTKAKCLINRYFNVGHYITTISQTGHIF